MNCAPSCSDIPLGNAITVVTLVHDGLNGVGQVSLANLCALKRIGVLDAGNGTANGEGSGVCRVDGEREVQRRVELVAVDVVLQVSSI